MRNRRSGIEVPMMSIEEGGLEGPFLEPPLKAEVAVAMQSQCAHYGRSKHKLAAPSHPILVHENASAHRAL